MPGNTPSGLPYPLPTEPVAEGAAAIRALAEALEGRPKSAQGSSAVFGFAANDTNYRIYVPPITAIWNDWTSALFAGGTITIPATGRYYLACTLRNPIAGSIGVGTILNDAIVFRKLQTSAVEAPGAQRADYTSAGFGNFTAGMTIKYYGYDSSGTAGTTNLVWELMLLGKPIGAALLREAEEIAAFYESLERVDNPEYAE